MRGTRFSAGSVGNLSRSVHRASGDLRGRNKTDFEEHRKTSLPDARQERRQRDPLYAPADRLPVR